MLRANRLAKQLLTVAALTTCSLLIFIALAGTSGNKAHAEAGFIDRVAPFAQEAQRQTGVPASVTLAQAVLESNWGAKPIPGTNNYFGIKAFTRADGSIDLGRVAIGWVWYPTTEWNGYRSVYTLARFRQYRSIADSFLDHAYFFLDNPRYGSALLMAGEPKEFARRIALAGYATDPAYANSLIGLMDDENLYRYDLSPDAAGGSAEFSAAEDPTAVPKSRINLHRLLE